MGLSQWSRVRREAGCLLACLAWALPVSAQSTASLSGRVTDRSTGQGIRNAQIILITDSRSVTSDSVGKYVFPEIPPGVSQFIVRASNFPAQQIIVELTEGQRAERPVLLDSTAFGRLAAAQSLPAVSVEAIAPVNYRMVGFERRRQTGRGQYLTEEDILKSNAYNLADAVKALRGVTYECGGGAGCYIRMARAPGRCLPQFFVDDQVNNDFGILTPIRDIIGLEVYTGPSDVPGEYAGSNSMCGVVVVWTRSGPTRRARR